MRARASGLELAIADAESSLNARAEKSKGYLSSAAHQGVTTPSIAAARMIVVEPKSRTVVLERNSTALGPVGSIQKLLTALLIVERGGLNSSVVIRPEDIPANAQLPTVADLHPGDTHSRQGLLTAMLVGSANDAANALARDHSGSVTAFANQMNVRAKELGMKSSKFFNPTGLPHEGQISSAEDVAALASIADEVPTLRAAVSMPDYTLRHSDGTMTRLKNTNRLLSAQGACDGMKTGFTRASGHCLVASGSFRELRRIVIVLNSVADQVWNDASQLLNFSLGIAETTNGVAGASG